MATLIQGSKPVANGGGERKAEKGTGQPSSSEQQAAGPARSSNQLKLLRISLFVADGLLVLLAARVAFKSGGSFGVAEAALCAGALGMGAWLTVVALHMKQ